MSFCPRCGKPTEHQFCLDCLRELHPLIKNIKPVTVTMCPVCLRVFLKASWIKRDLQEVIERQVERSLTLTQDATITGMVLEPAAPEPGKQELQLTIIGSVDGSEPYEESYVVTILVAGNRCTQCERLANTYFNGILQLRRPNDTVMHEIERLLGKSLSNAKDVTGGIDYYVMDHHILQNVAREVHARFGGELSINAQHFSYDSLASKNLYRVNALLRLPKFWKGSLIHTGAKYMFITSMGKVLKGIDILTGKTMSAPTNNSYPDFPQQQTTIVTTRPTITVLDPETFQTVAIANDLPLWKDLQAGDKVTVAVIDEGVCILPPQ
jgi:nonsense-mediated mRNA decay protein 3